MPSRSPYCCSRLAAVLSPTPLTPGRPSDGSPRSAAKSAYCSGRTPYLRDHGAVVDDLEIADTRVRCRARVRRRSSSTSWNRSRSPVTTSTRRPRSTPACPMMSSASKCGAPTTAISQRLEHLADDRDLRVEGVGCLLDVDAAWQRRRRPGAPCSSGSGRPATAGRQSSSQQATRWVGSYVDTSLAMKSSRPADGVDRRTVRSVHRVRDAEERAEVQRRGVEQQESRSHNGDDAMP